jgi:hypothetical protein
MRGLASSSSDDAHRLSRVACRASLRVSRFDAHLQWGGDGMLVRTSNLSWRSTRAFVATLVAVLAVVGIAAGRAAAGPPGLERKLNATVSGTVNVTTPAAGCAGIVTGITDATLVGSPALGHATIHIEICVTSVVPNDQFFGTFVISNRLGTLTGTIVVSSPDAPGSDPQRITGTLTPTGGSGPIAKADDPLSLRVETHGAYPAPVDGTIAPT